MKALPDEEGIETLRRPNPLPEKVSMKALPDEEGIETSPFPTLRIDSRYEGTP